MRYKTATKNPAYLGGVDEFDIYITPSMNVVARWGGARGHRFSLPVSYARCGFRWRREFALPHEKSETIAAMVRCFGPEERKPRYAPRITSKEKTDVQQ
jgi:hypothetical protein